MKLNFGHTFAHAIEAKNNYSKNITHGEAVLTRYNFSNKIISNKNICSKKLCKN